MMTPATYRQHFFIEDEDIANVRFIGDKIAEHLPALLDDFYTWMRTMPEFSSFFPREEHVAHVKKQQLQHWQAFFKADINEFYIQSRYRIGQAHARVGLPLDVYYRSVVVFHDLFAKLFRQVGIDDFNSLHSFQKLVGLDTSIVVDTYNQLVSDTIREQNQALMQLSTPVTQLWDGILLLPLVGIIDSRRAQDTMTAVLHRVASSQSKVFILDISGVAVVDTAVANHLIKITKATRLMGCLCILSGISPAVAQTIVELGVQIEEVTTTANMQDALAQALRMTGTVLSRQQSA